MPTTTDIPTTRVSLGPGGAGASRLDLATGLLAPRLLSHTGRQARVALLATHATLLGGDQVRIEVEVAQGCFLELVDIAATVAYHARGRTSRIDVTLDVAPGATVIWHAEPLVVSAGANVVRTLTASVAQGASLLLRDTLVLGRSGEQSGSLRCHTETSYASRPALVEDLTLGPQDGMPVADLPMLPGYLEAQPSSPHAPRVRVVDSALALGWRPGGAEPPRAAGDDTSIFALEQPGSLARELLPDAHCAHIPHLFETWAAEVATSN